MTALDSTLSSLNLSAAQGAGTLETLLETTCIEKISALRRKALKTTMVHCGKMVYFRGIIEFSNICHSNCHYCGIRRANRAVRRYRLSKKQIIDLALWCADNGFGSVVLQSGERRDQQFIDFLLDVVGSIKAKTRSSLLPKGLGITLSVGEQSRNVYQRLFDAGAHRYLLRIETTSPRLYKKWHPPDQTHANRRRCLKDLAAIGYQVGTGVMIGAPGQTAAHLAQDILFFKQLNVDMIGMGPYIPHNATPLAPCPVPTAEERLRLGLLTIALTRLLLKDVNIAATTALQTLTPLGRELGLAFGANVIMPRITPSYVLKDYSLYDGKPETNETTPKFQQALEVRILKMGRKLGFNAWGDSPHALARGV